MTTPHAHPPLHSARLIRLKGHLLVALALASIAGLPRLQAQYIAPFDLLRFSFDAPLSALGQVHVTHSSGTLASSWQNPARQTAQDSLTRHEGSFSALLHYANTWGGEVNYAWSKGRHSIVAGARYFSYGSIAGYDVRGQQTDDFSAGTQLFTINYAHTIHHFALGIGFKPAFTYIAQSVAHHGYIDLGATYQHPAEDLSIGVVVKHLPLYRIRSPHFTYTSTADLWMGISYRPRDFPLRFSLHAQDLLRRSDVPTPDSGVAAGLVEKTLSKLVFGLEAFIGQHVVLMGGYNAQKRQQLRLDDQGGLSGFSFGGRFKTTRYTIAASAVFDRLSQLHAHVTFGMNFYKTYD